MAIDASALTSINNAIKSYGGKVSTTENKGSSLIETISRASAEIATTSRYKTAFEEKMKAANSTEDTVEISEDSLAALKKYNSKQSQDAEDTKMASSTYDYMSIKRKNAERLAAIEKELSAKYGTNSQQNGQESTQGTDVTN